MRHFRRHANGFAQRGVRVDGLANIHRIRAHLNRQGNLANHVARMGADHAAAQDFAVAMRFGGVVKQQFGDTFVAAIGNGTARCVPGEQAFFDLDALRLGLVFGEADSGHFGIGIGDGCQFLVALLLTSDDFGRKTNLVSGDLLAVKGAVDGVAHPVNDSGRGEAGAISATLH